MSAQRARSSIPAERRSAHPNITGVPWWGAVLIAAGLTAAGFIFDLSTGRTELTKAFSVLYVVGCIAAVLAVRHSGIFTAVVQPPLILFVAVPSAYFLFHMSEIKGVKDVLINCGYPLIERFLLMFTTTVIVLLVGMARWYFGTAPGSGAGAPAAKAAAAVGGVGLVGAVKSKLASLSEREPADADADDLAAKPLKHGIDRPATAPPRERVRRPTKRSAPTTSRHARPPINDPLAAAGDPDAPPPRRRRPTHSQDLDEIVRNLDAEPLPPRRRTRPPGEPGRRTPPPQERREPRQRDPRDPRVPRNVRDPRESRDGRDPRDRDPYERPRRPPERADRPAAPPHDPYDDGFDVRPPPPRKPAPSGSNGTHHPVSRVRYRGSDADGGQDNHAEYRSQPRNRHRMDDPRFDG